MRVKDRVAIVTGGAQGLGEGISLRLAQDGAKVAVVDVNQEGANKTVARIQEMGSEAAAFNTNVADKAQVQALCEAVVAKWGRIDILVNNAGLTRDGLAVRMKDEDWQAVIDVDLTAGFRLARGCLRGMMKRRWGRIVGIASVVGVTGNAGQANYAAAKAGMIGLSKALAAEVASRGITVNCVAPGFIATAMTEALPEDRRARLAAAIPAGRLGSAEDVAACVVFLAGDEAAYVTGQTLHVNGGMAMI